MKDLLGNRLILDTDKYPEYSRDASEITFKPAALYFPENENDIINAINSCRRSRIPIVWRGAGTGYTGGAVPSEGALVISLEKLNQLKIDSSRRMAFCGPGIITLDLMKAAEKQGLFYPPDPASYAESTLGGNVAENAGGLHCKKYGVTRDYIIGLRGITIDGRILNTGIYSDNRDLFDITAVLIGSEGLLAAITEIAVRLIDLPQFSPTILAAFTTPEDAARVVAEITLTGIVPSVMEYMDGDAIACSMEYEKSIDMEPAAALLLLETAGDKYTQDADRAVAIMQKHRPALLRIEADREKSNALWQIRRNLSKAVKASAKYKISEDVAVPPSRLPELVSFVYEMNSEYPLRINSYGHAGDGNLHVNFLTSDDYHVKSGLVENGIKRLFDKTLALDGTLTGEHGIGLTKKKYLQLEFDSPTISAMRDIKTVFDPDGLLCPGKMFT